MKHIKSIFFPAAIALALSSCSEDDIVYKTFPAPDWTVVTNYTQSPTWTVTEENSEVPQWELDMKGNDETPQWSKPDEGMYQFSMTAVIRLSEFLERYADENDRIAAFIGNECRGIATPQNVDGAKLYFLYIKGNTSDTEKITLGYYSAGNKKMYSCDRLLDFEQNGVYGSANAPEMPPFDLTGKYPYVMNVVIALPDDFASAPQAADLIGAFAGSECRGTGTATANNGKTFYAFEIRGTGEAAQRIDFRYYAATDRKVYNCTVSVPFEVGGRYGTETEPAVLPSFLKGKYPLTMSVAVKLPDNLTGYILEQDKLAAFVGNECRGIGKMTSNRTGETIYTMDVIGSGNEAEIIHFKYYSTKSSYLYEDATDVVFDATSQYGTEENAVTLNLKNVE